MANMPDVLATDAFSMTTLTDKVSKLPAKNVQLAQFFEDSSVNTETIQVDVESGVLVILPTVARSALPTHVTGGRSRTAKSINSVKIGTKVALTANDIASVRRFGTETEAETFASVLDPRLEDANANLDATHENHRAGAFRGVVLDSDGTTVLHNLYTLFGIAAPALVYLDLESIANLGDLRTALNGIKNGIRDAAGRAPINGFVAVAGRNAYQTFTNHPAVLAAFERWEDGAWLRGENGGGFIFAGIEFLEYTGSSVDDDEILFAPKMHGLFRTVYTTPDEPELAGTMGRPTYVIPQPQETSKSWSAEVSSFPVHYCTRPDLLRRAVIGADPEA